MPRLDIYVDFTLFLMIKLPAGKILLGRSAECDIQFPENRVSRVHATVETTDKGHILRDCSANGTRVNDKMITNDAFALTPGDRIYIASYVLMYQPDDAEPEEFSQENTFQLR